MGRRERHIRKVVHASFEGSVSSPEDNGCNSILDPNQSLLVGSGNSVFLTIVRRHPKLFETLICLSHTLAVVHVQSSKCLDLIVQMSN